jgi:DNA modification methylase
MSQQITLPLDNLVVERSENGYVERLLSVLSDDLDFKSKYEEHLSHKLHSFPAKFPPALPQKFIAELTEEGETVLDPMMGSGTTILESYLSGRQAVGFDIDPLALMLTRVKVSPLDKSVLHSLGLEVLDQANKSITGKRTWLQDQFEKRFDSKTKEFIDYWFYTDTQLELMALLVAIESIRVEGYRDFLYLVFSSIIITKSGGVSLALDLAHTRPHRAKIVVSKTGEVLLGKDVPGDTPNIKVLTKTLRSPLEEFNKKFQQNLRGVIESLRGDVPPRLIYGNAQALSLADESVDLVVTSPPYASNAIDYMRAHKFSLVWLGHTIDSLMQKRKTYIGSEGATDKSVDLPDSVSEVIAQVSSKKASAGRSLHRYYSEMSFALKEMYRVLRPGKSAIVVVGNSILAGQDARVQYCLANIGKSLGFEVPKIGVRQLDRNKRMLPAGNNINKQSQIQQRMHEEYLIGLYKPEAYDASGL